MAAKNKFKVVMIKTKLPDTNMAIFTKIKNVYGDRILNQKLDVSYNPTYVRNISLTSQKRAATNALDDYKFNHLYITSNDRIKKGDFFIYDGEVRKCDEADKHWVTSYTHIDSTSKSGIAIQQHHGDLIIASTNKSVTPNKIRKPFINKYIKSFNNGDKIINLNDDSMIIKKETKFSLCDIQSAFENGFTCGRFDKLKDCDSEFKRFMKNLKSKL